MTLLAFWLRSWWKLQISFAILSIPLLSFYFLVPESPRWLFGKGRTKEAKSILLKIAEVNKTDISKTSFQEHFDELENRIFQEMENKSTQSAKRCGLSYRILCIVKYFISCNEDVLSTIYPCPCQIFRSLLEDFVGIISGVLTNKEYLLRLFLMLPPW